MKFFLVVIGLLSWEADFLAWGYAKKHETAEQLLASGKLIQNQNRAISDSITAFDAYRNTKVHNETWSGPVPTIKPLIRDYDYFGYDDQQANKEQSSSNKNGSTALDKDSSERSTTTSKTRSEDDDKSLSFESLKGHEFGSAETFGGGGGEIDANKEKDDGENMED